MSGFCSIGARMNYLNTDLFITSVLAQDAMVKYHRPDGLSNNSGGWKSQIMQSLGLAWLGSGKNSLFGLQTAAVLPHPGREKQLCSLSTRALMPLWVFHPHDIT